ncbi:hypothetical protein ACFY5D_18600 [Paeniglutamicibacter sp. NPDC012692]|uniref:hypothetical protein n=1 Tax=Paeniglutamicibacter sp. NPDC012692 TaxID=3364388 RepID=UPI0036796D48
MIVDGFFIAGAILCAVALILGVVATIIREYPDDFALVSVALLEVFLVVYGVSAAIRQAGGQPISGEPWEFWGYLLTALLIPALAFIWAVTDKSRWSNTVLAVSGVIVFVMLFRMEQIWDGAIAA